MRVHSKLVLCSAALTISLAATGCASRRASSSRSTTTTASRTTTTTTGATATTPRTDTTQDVSRTAGSNDSAERLENATTAFQEIMSVPEQSIPQDLLNRSQCIIVVPHMKKGAFVVGAQYGKGYFSCRSSSGQGWTAPASVRVEGGSVGFQIGGEETDLVLLVMNRQGQDRLLQSQFQLGADASVAAGPVGREASAATDAYMTAQMLAWSRSRGAFAGVALKGSTIRQDLDDNQQLYGRRVTNKEIIEGNVTEMPPAAQQFVSLLNKLSPRQVS